MQIYRLNSDNRQEIIQKVVDSLLNEELVILPTDTVYGIMSLVESQEAIKKLYAAKQRDFSKPTALLVHSVDKAQELLGNSTVSVLAKKFWPGALTIIKEPKRRIFNWPKLGVRIPDDLFLLEVLAAIDQPVMASSANVAGEQPPTTIAQVSSQLHKQVQVAVDSGPTKLVAESTIVEIEQNKIVILREGPISGKEIMKAVNSEL